MVDATSIRAKLSVVLARDDLSRSIEIQHVVSYENDYGEDIDHPNNEYFDNQDVVTGIVLQYVEAAPKHDNAGKYPNSSLIILLPAATTISETDRIVVGSIEYDVDGLNPVYIGETLVMYKVFCSEYSGEHD